VQTLVLEVGVEGDSIQLVQRWRDGDQQAATELFRRCAERLVALVRSRLSGALAQRLDAEDVVQSACRSFFHGVRNERLVVQRSGDLWRLLAAIALHKLHHQVEKQQAGKRAVSRERGPRSDDSTFGLPVEVVAREPAPSDAAAAIDELEHILRPLEPLHRRMVELRLEGYTFEEIGAAVGRSERLVRLVLDRVRTRLHERLEENQD